MRDNRQKCPAGLAELSDDQLVVRARPADESWCWASAELLRRHMPRVRRIIGKLAATAGLSREDTEDEQQLALEILPEVIQRYQPSAGANPRAFEWFWQRAVRDHFRNSRRNHHRAERHVDRSVADDDVLEGQACHQPASVCAQLAHVFDNPLDAAARQERAEWVQRLLHDLSPDRLFLWERRARGLSMAEIADELGVSRNTAWRRWHALTDELRRRAAETGAK